MSQVDMMIVNSTAPTPTAIRIVIEIDQIDTTMVEPVVEEIEVDQLLHLHIIENKVVEQCIMV